ncbi:MAG: WGxxGxxG-CTERM domain-containing protein, partial [Gemmatimonadetes bacterium]|nr:WGxxGxxG-CTERM domain-containing protein [Gemmatimonadota bacterium]
VAAQNGTDTVTRTVTQEDRGMDWGWLGLLGLAGLLGLRRRDEHVHHTDRVRVDPDPGPRVRVDNDPNVPPPRV